MEIRNRSAFHEFFIEDKYDAGMVLTGTEVKALRSGKASFNDSFCTIDRGEVWLRNLHIAEYEYGTYANHPPLRERKLLLRKREIKKLVNKLKRITKQLPIVFQSCFQLNITPEHEGNLLVQHVGNVRFARPNMTQRLAQVADFNRLPTHFRKCDIRRPRFGEQ